MTISIVALPGFRHHGEAAAALRAGLARHGVNADIVTSWCDARSDTVACWGWRVGSRLQDAMRGRQVLVMEAGYVADRLQWTSMGWNGLNGRADFPLPEDDGDRWRRHFGDLCKAWTLRGDHVLLCGQVPGDSAIAHVDVETWYRDTAGTIRDCHGVEVRFRPHPNAPNVSVRGLPTVSEPLADALRGALWVATYNSNIGVDAALAGVPVVACDVGSMAWDVSAHHPADEPGTPDRTVWCNELAWCQWSRDEIENGEAWDALKACLD